MAEQNDRNALWGKLAKDLEEQKQVMRSLRLGFVVIGGFFTLLGIGFIALTLAFSKKESIFSRGEIYAGIAFILCGITLATWARRRASDHLKLIDAELAERTNQKQSD